MKRMFIMLGMTGLMVVALSAQTMNQSVTGRSGYSEVLLQKPAAESIWAAGGISAGFRPDLQEAGVSVGSGWATHEIGGKKSHDLAIGQLYYGHMLGGKVGGDHWYAGNWEFIEDLFGGWQYNAPVGRYLIGETTMLRYNFVTGTRWVPFMDAGVGGSLTDIGHPDLGTPGEFNEQIGPGISYFWRENSALTLQYRYMHNSNAGIKTPNQGLNENIFYLGMSWYF